MTIYPFAKRFTWWPQVFLGLAFNWGILILFVAHTGSLNWPIIALYFSGIFWTLFYDTIYALQDIKDDTLIGVKSTARLFGKKIKNWLFLFIILFLSLLIISILLTNKVDNYLRITIFFIGMSILLFHLIFQIKNLNVLSTISALKTFKSNRNSGFIVVLTLIGISI